MRRAIFLLVFLLAGLGWFTAPAYAITVFSPVVELEAVPGQTSRGLVKLYNETDEPVVLQASVERFSAGDETGTPKFSAGPSDEFLRWFHLDKTRIILEPRQVGLIPFSVRVPERATPGGYYAAILWKQTSSASADSQVAVAGKIGTLVLLKVPGQLKEELALEQFSTLDGSLVVASLPVGFVVRLKNSGNIHVAPEASLEIRNWLGLQEVIAVADGKREILPDSTRRFEVSWGAPRAEGQGPLVQGAPSSGTAWQRWLGELGQELTLLPVGRHTAQLTLHYGTSTAPISQTLTFWVWPVRLLGLLIGLLVLVVGMLALNRRIKRTHRKNVS